MDDVLPILRILIGTGFVCWVTANMLARWKSGQLVTSRFLRGLTIVSVLLGVVLLGDRIIAFSGLGLQFSMQQKVQEVKSLAEEVAELAAFTARTAMGSATIDWAGPSAEDLKLLRERALRTLREAGAEPSRITEMEQEFTEALKKRERIDSRK